MTVRSRPVIPALGALVALAAAGCSRTATPTTASSPYGCGPRVEVSSESLAGVSTDDVEVRPVLIGAGDGEGAMLYMRLLAYLEHERAERRAAYAAAEEEQASGDY